ncbi:hypothetical protein ACIRBY_29525 [Streptomyces sp. NPDC096136]|uniref:hypothetical protein n=1 Tax=Streptomyces sp. NPDC096136 TaxID=3366076 RepID=UPI0037F53356
MSGWKKPAGRSLPAGRQHFLGILKNLEEVIAADSQAHLVRLLQERGCPVDRSSLSRYLGGQRNPGQRFVAGLYELAVHRAGEPEAVGLTWPEVAEAHERTELRKAPKCSNCVVLEGRNAELGAALAAAEAGPRSVASAVRGAPTPPPVPLRRGDRRRDGSDARAAERFAASAMALDADGRVNEVVAAMADAVDFLTPVEAAAAYVALGAGGDGQLAGSLGQMYARERQGRTVIRMALELQDKGMAQDATAILRWAAAVDGVERAANSEAGRRP